MGYFEDRQLWNITGKPKKEKKVYIIPKKSQKKIAEEKAEKEERSPDGTELQKWYAGIMEREEGRCWETGENIDKRNREQVEMDYPNLTGKEVKDKADMIRFGWHGSVAHCLPKSDFPSVATNPLNYMILKMWGGTHGQYDSSWENASKMKVWKHCCKIFNILYPLLTPEEKRKLPDVIIQEIKPEIYNK